jgi:hypothetical protein
MAISTEKNDRYVNKNSDIAGFENLTRFETFFTNRYLDPATTGHAFVFVTKPSLFIHPYAPSGKDTDLEKLAYENMTRHHLFSQFLASEAMNGSDKILVEQLSYYDKIIPSSYNRSNFLPIFTNRSKSFSTTDMTLNQNDAFETRQGFRMPMPTHKNESVGSGTVSISCQETTNLDIMKTLTIWVNYISNVTDGTFHANPVMIKNGVLDYTSSIYYFLLSPDGKTLKYWSKYTGCWPTTVPQSNLSFTRGSQDVVETEVQFAYSAKEDMNPSILEDFNRVSLNFFEKDVAEVDNPNEDFPSVKNSRLLSRTAIRSNSKYIRDLRGPLVFYSNGLEDNNRLSPQNSRFELTFGLSTFNGTFVDEKFGGDYLFNIGEFFSSTLDKE